jgi:hypothetical protein
MQSRTRSLFMALLLLCTAGAAFAQGVNITTGAISGTVTDNTGGALPGVTVTATNLGTGLTRDAVTESDGAFLLNLLPPGKYRIDAELAGLGKSTVPGVNVLLGNTTKADVKLTPALSEQITVTAAAPVVDTTRSGTAVSVTEQQIEELPILTRDFRALAQLTPGVVTAFGSRITSNGARGISTDYNIDGASSNNDFFGEQTGGTRAPFTFSQAAVKEFQVIRSQYDAEYGRGVGATLNAITKSGSNDLSGEVFYYLRKGDWASSRSREFPNGQVVTDSFVAKDSNQPGFAVGGPIMRDKLFFFANYDGQRQEQPITATDIRNNTTFAALPDATKTAFFSKIQNLIGFPYEEGLGYDQTFNQNTYLVKFDLNAGSKNHFSLRDNYSKFTNGNNQSFNHFSNQGVENDQFNQAVLQGETVFTSSLFNQFIVQHSTDERPIEPRTTTPEVAITYATGVAALFLGQNDFLPNNTKETKTQLKDTLSFVWNNHTFKGGVEALLVSIDNLFPRNLNGVFRYNNVANFVADKPDSYNQGFGAGGGLTSWDQNTYALYAADSFRMGNRWTFDLGLRYDWQTVPEPDVNAFPQHPEFISQIEDDHNLAPRVGFAYDVTGNGRSVLRGGSGLFYGYMPAILLSNPLTQISGNFIQVSIANCNAANLAVKCPTYPSILTPEQFGQLARIATDVVTIGSNYEAQEAWRSSLQFEQQLGSTYSAAVGVIYQKTDNVQGTRNINAVPQAYTFGNLPIYNVASASRPYADMGVVRELFSGEEATYRAFTVETHKLAVNNSSFTWDLSYTWSKSIDQDSNERSTSTSFLYDPRNPELSEGPSDNDVRHRVVGDVTYRLPWGFAVSAIGSWRTGTPYTLGNSFAGAMNINGVTQTSGNIPVFVNRDGTIIEATLLSGKTRTEIAAALADAHIIGRNTERQPDVWNADLRLAKTFGLPGGFELEVLGEVFNVFNVKNRFIGTANQTLFNWVYTAATDRYTITKNTFADGTQRLATTSSYEASVDPRQFQVAAKIRF